MYAAYNYWVSCLRQELGMVGRARVIARAWVVTRLRAVARARVVVRARVVARVRGVTDDPRVQVASGCRRGLILYCTISSHYMSKSPRVGGDRVRYVSQE